MPGKKSKVENRRKIAVKGKGRSENIQLDLKNMHLKDKHSLSHYQTIYVIHSPVLSSVSQSSKFSSMILSSRIIKLP